MRDTREAAGLSQRKLAFPGCSSAYISRIEAGERIPSLQVLRELARRIGTSESYLAWGVDEPTPEPTGLVEAEVALRLGDADEAHALFEEVASSSADRDIRARALAGLGHVALLGHEFGRAVERFEQARTLAPELDDPAVVEGLGRAYASLGEHGRAVALFEARLEEARGRGDQIEELRFAVLLANALVDGGELPRSKQLLASALGLAKKSGDPLTVARLHWSQSRLYAMESKPDLAARYARRALGVLEATEHTRSTAQAYHLLAFIELDRGNAEAALDLLEHGEELLAGAATDYDRGKFSLERAKALVQLGRAAEALKLAHGAAALLRDGDPIESGRSFAALAATFAGLDETERAIELYELAIEQFEENPNRYLAEACVKLGELYESIGEREQALATFKRAAALQAASEPARDRR